MHTSTLRVGFVPGVEPDRFLQRWKAARRSAYLELVPVPLCAQQTALAECAVDMCFVRLPLDAEVLHLVPLWEERAAVVLRTEHVLSLFDEVGPEDLEGVPEIPAADADDAAERIAAAATGVGFTRVPLSLARLHHRKDAVSRPLREAAPTRIALAWPRTADDPLRQRCGGAVRGRTARSSR